jgi:hypothetical protein
MGKKELRIFLLVRADARASVQSLASLIPALPSSPAHWAIPSGPLAGPDAGSWAAFLGELPVRRPLDLVVAVGYAGAPHPMLQLEELRREVEWGQHPPGDAVRPYRAVPGVLAPVAADFLRPEALRLYATKGLRRVVVPAEGCWPAASETGIEGARLQVLYYHPAAQVAAERPAPLVERVAGGVLGIAVDPENGRALRSALDRLASRASLVFLRLDEPVVVAQPGPLAPLPGSDPALRDRASSVSAFRTHRQAIEETATVLQVLSGLRSVAGPDRSVAVFPASKRENTAVMMGAVSLSDGALGAQFDAGRLTGLAWNGRPVTPLVPARSYAGPPRRPRPYEVTNGFALEADRLRGLRCIHRLAGESAALSLEYFFVEDFPVLVVTGRVRYPRRRGLESVSPLEIAVAPVPEGEAVTVHVLSRGEAPYEVRVADGDPPVCLSGSLFWFQGSAGGLIAGFPPVKEPVLESVWLHTERLQTGGALFASFFANRDRSGAFLGREELFSLYLGVAFEVPSALPAFPRAVLDEVPYHALAE